ncbi:MAG: DegT/DnrJ/EryC1/StrS family aminotransferase [Rubricoccaceae bacterium]
MTATSIPILDLGPEIDEHWEAFNEAFQRVLRSGRFIGGPEVQAFETEAAAYLGVEHAVGLNSGTDALVIALRALGIGAGDEVITTPFTFFATAEAISLVGATPVFVDVDASSFNIDPSRIEAAITERTRAVLPVHLYGQPAAMTRILEIARRHGLRVIEDCAQSFGARYAGACTGCDGANCNDTLRHQLDGRMTGTMGDFGTYSFFPSKNLGAFGDGGMLVTNDASLAELAVKLRAHGGAHKYHNEMLGYNSRLDALQAAMLRIKLPHVDTANAARREVAQRYTSALADIDGIVTPGIPEGHVFHQYTIRVLNGRRDELAEALELAGIQTMVYYPVPCHRLPVYRDNGWGPFPVADELAGEVLSLPVGSTMPPALVDHIALELTTALA